MPMDLSVHKFLQLWVLNLPFASNYLIKEDCNSSIIINSKFWCIFWPCRHVDVRRAMLLVFSSIEQSVRYCSQRLGCISKESLWEIDLSDNQNVSHWLRGHFELTCISHSNSYFLHHYQNTDCCQPTDQESRSKWVHCVSAEGKLPW